MARLSLWLPPFSPDYSGAAAVLFDLKTVTAMHDASGCTGNYTGYDEPRWYGSRSGIFCSGLRRIDAILGGDEKLLNKMEMAAKDIRPEIMALIGSPVPMVIGADLKGMAAELEERTGIPCFGFDTTGTAYYDKGAFEAARQLLERFATEGPVCPKRVNILGALPMDFGKGENLELLKSLLLENGYETGLNLAMGYSLEDLKKAARARVNVAVSRFGYLVARYLERRFGTPYVCGFPAGKKGTDRWLEALARAAGRKESVVVLPDHLGTAGKQLNSGKTLIIGEQVMSNALRVALTAERGDTDVTVGCLYGIEKELAIQGDLDLTDEKKIKAAVNSAEYGTVIADPFLKMLMEEEGTCRRRFLPFSQYGVSSSLGQETQPLVVGENFNKWMMMEEM